MLEPLDVTVGGHRYKVGRLDLFDSLNVSRLAAPILPILFHEVLSKVALEVMNSPDADKASPEERIEAIGKLIYLSAPILKALADMPEANFRKIVRTCLSCVERKCDKLWSRVMADGNLMFQDMTQQDCMTLVIHVLSRELRPTIAALGLFGGAAANGKTAGSEPSRMA